MSMSIVIVEAYKDFYKLTFQHCGLLLRTRLRKRLKSNQDASRSADDLTPAQFVEVLRKGAVPKLRLLYEFPQSK
jgi:hypothetical protein